MVYINTDCLDLNRQTVRTRVDSVTETVTAASLLLKELPLRAHKKWRVFLFVDRTQIIREMTGNIRVRIL